MANHKGAPKLGGRKKGTPNKKKSLRLTDAATILRNAGKHPVKELLRVIPQLEPKDQARFWLELFSYVYPKPREVPQEPEAYEVDDTATLSDTELLELAAVERAKEEVAVE